MFEVVRHGDAIALMPQRLAAVHPPGLRTIAIDRDLPRCDVVLVTPTTRTVSPAVGELLDSIATDLFGYAAA
jgi:DNA-binding transcriptional LysR family regulator